MIITSKQAAELMPEVTGIIFDNVYSIGGVGIIIITAYADTNGPPSGIGRVEYEMLNELESNEYLKENNAKHPYLQKKEGEL